MKHLLYIFFYSFETGLYDFSRIQECDSLKQAKDAMGELCVTADKFYKQIFIKDETGKNVFYHANFQ